MLVVFWNQFLFKPIFNILIFLYNNFTNFNFGIAVIYLTVLIRILLLPLSVTTSKSREFYHRLSEKVKEIDKDYGSDYIKKKEVIRDFLKKSHVRPWTKAVILGAQLLVLILLYQVFVGGLNVKEKYDLVYPFITRPDYVATKFLWFDLAKRDWGISSLAGFFLFIEIMLTQSNKKEILSRREQLYKIFFPIFTIVALGILPSVKSVFILTSIIFSIILIFIMNTVESFGQKAKKKEAERPKVDLRDIKITRI